LDVDRKEAIKARVIREVRENRWDPETNTIGLTEAQLAGFEKVNEHYVRVFTDPTYSQAFRPTNYISDPKDLRDLSAFTFWGAVLLPTPGQA
jgi:nitric oxide reductase subunit B